MFSRIMRSLPVFLTLILAMHRPCTLGGEQNTETFDRQLAAVPGLWRGDDSKAQFQSLHCLGRLGPRAASAVPVLIVRLSDRETKIRKETAMVQRRIGLPTRSAVPALMATSNAPNGTGWSKSAWAIGAMKSDPAEIIPALVSSIHAEPDRRYRSAVYVLETLGKLAVPTRIDIIKGSDPMLRWIAVNALVQVGPMAKAAIPELIRSDTVSKMADRLFILLDNANEEIHRHIKSIFLYIRSMVTARLVHCLTDPSTGQVFKVELLRVLADKNRIGAFKSASGSKVLRPDLKEDTTVLGVLSHEEEDEVRVNDRKLLAAVEPGVDTAARLLLETTRAKKFQGWNVNRAIEKLEPSAVDVMIDGLSDPDEEVRTVAAYALGELGKKLPRPNDEPEQKQPDPDKTEGRRRGLKLRSQAADALVTALKDPDTQVRWAAAWALFRLGTGEKSVPALVQIVNDRTTRMRSGASIRFVVRLGGSGQDWCERSAKGDLLRIGAIQALGSFGALAAPAVPALIDAMRDQDLLTRGFAAAVLAEIGPQAKAAVPQLIILLKSKDVVPLAPCSMGFGGKKTETERLAVIAARALDRIGPDARAAVTALTEALADSDEVLRYEAAKALGSIGADAAPAIPILVQVLNDPERLVGDIAADALSRIGSAAIPALIEVLRGSKPEIRRRALTSLGGIGAKADVALPDLIRSLTDPDEEIRAAAANAIGLVGDANAAMAAVPDIIAATKDTDRIVRRNIAEALGRIGPRDARVIPSLLALMRDSDPEVKVVAGDAMARIGMQAFPALRALLCDRDKDLRDNAALALSRIADPVNGSEDVTEEHAHNRAMASRNALIEAMKDPNELIRAGASRALGYLGNDIVPELVEALNDPSPLVRVHTLQALEFVGGEARSALNSLRERLDDPNPEVRRAAESTIKVILKPNP